MRTDAAHKKRKLVYVQFLLATTVVGVLASYALAKEGSDRTGAFAGVACSASLGLLALYLKQWAIERSLKASFAMVGTLFVLRLIVLAIGIGASRLLDFNGLAFAAGFLSIYFVLQWIEIGYLTSERNKAKREEL